MNRIRRYLNLFAGKNLCEKQQTQQGLAGHDYSLAPDTLENSIGSPKTTGESQRTGHLLEVGSPLEFSVWFAEGPTAGKHFMSYPLRWKLRLLKRDPALIYYLFGSELIKKITGTKYSHVLIEYDGVVLDPMFQKNKYWEASVFKNVYPGSKCSFKMYCLSGKPDLGSYEDNRDWGPLKTSVWGTFFRLVSLFSLGNVRLDEDCVSVAISIICRCTKHKVPRNIFTPVQLMRWLEEVGYDRITTIAPNKRGATNRRVR